MSNVRLLQLNLHRSETGTASLNQFLGTLRGVAPPRGNHNPTFFIAGVQEPPTSAHTKILGFEKRHPLIYDRSTERPRAALYHSAGLSVWPVPEFTKRDIATGRWRIGESEADDVYVTSVYMDITAPGVWPAELSSLLRMCDRRNRKVLIMADANAHSTLWGSDATNSRGEALEQLILRHGLAVLNRGTEYTFFNKRARTHPDVTLCSAEAETLFSKWKVSDEVTGSDHRLISFSCNFTPPPPEWKRNFRRGSWKKFCTCLFKKNFLYPTTWSERTVEKQLAHLYSCIEGALDESHPKKKVTFSVRPFKWWDETLTQLHKRQKTAYNQFRRFKSERTHDRLVEARQTFRKELRRTKRAGWQAFTEEASNPRETARLINIIRGDSSHQLGLIKDDLGLMIDSPQGSLNRLVDVHFPGNQEKRQEDTSPSRARSSCDITEDAAAFISLERVREAVNSFGSYKAPGTDGLPPCVLQNLEGDALYLLVDILKACFLLGYTPIRWRVAKVIFIPKPGKKDYEEARAFRPISLMNVMYKALERVVLMELQATSLFRFPLHESQHAFRKGRGTDSALSSLIGFIEKALLSNAYALGTFLDIQGAFDNVKTEKILQGLGHHQVPAQVITWYKSYLTNRCIHTELKGASVKRFLTRGTPQGGILSPLMWNICFDSLLRSFDTSLVKCVGFADDGALITWGTNPNVLANRMQAAIDKAAAWGREQGLAFSATKTVAVVFTKKGSKRSKPFPPLKLDTHPLPYVEEVKYLGILLDQRLNWFKHIRWKIRVAKATLLKLRNATGKLWGLHPRMGRWAWIGVVRPAVTYGALVWAEACKNQAIQRQLNKLSRLALITLGFFRKSTPTAGLEVVLNAPPLDLRVKREAILAHARTKHLFPQVQDNPLKPIRYGHRAYCESLLREWELTLNLQDIIEPYDDRAIPFSLAPPDKGERRVSFSPQFEVFTNGSAAAGHAGCGFVIRKDGSQIHERSYPLGDTSDLQAEMYAVWKAGEWFNEAGINQQKIRFQSYSKEAFKTLHMATISSSFVRKIRLSLGHLGNNNEVLMQWASTTSDVPGIAQAESLAHLARSEEHFIERDAPSPSWWMIKLQVSSGMRQQWTTRWQQRADCRQTKIWFPEPHKGKTAELLGKSRLEVSSLVQCITGHNFLRKHEALIDSGESLDSCRYCEEDSVPESSFHVVGECRAFEEIRHSIFKRPNLADPPEWTVRKLASFLREASIGPLLGSEEVE